MLTQNAVKIEGVRT